MNYIVAISLNTLKVREELVTVAECKISYYNLKIKKCRL